MQRVKTKLFIFTLNGSLISLYRQQNKLDINVVKFPNDEIQNSREFVEITKKLFFSCSPDITRYVIMMWDQIFKDILKGSATREEGLITYIPIYVIIMMNFSIKMITFLHNFLKVKFIFKSTKPF